MKKIIASFIVLYSSISFAQDKVEFHTISKGNQEYLLKVSLPTDFTVEKDYPVLYYLDGWFLDGIVTGSYRVLRLCEYIEDVVLVGISIEGDELEFNTRRTMDFTPSKFRTILLNDSTNLKITFQSGIEEKGVKLAPETTGGADEFIKFLSNNLFPFVEKKYPNLNRKGLLGHSFGGLFGTYLIQKQPDLIDDYLLISGSLSWNEMELVNPESFHLLKNSSKNHQLFLTYGIDEIKLTTESNKELNQILNNLNNNNLNYRFQPYEKANHHSILSRAIYDGLLFLYEK